MPEGIINKAEVIRYLGYGSNSPDPETDKLIDEAIKLAQNELKPRAIHGIFELSDNFNLLSGNDIRAHLKGAESCVIFAATLGTKAELQINFFQKTDMQKAVIFDAVCDAFIEGFCDRYCKKLENELREKNLYLNTRFSPGYGDYSIEKQKDIISYLRADKLIGLTVTDSFILLPRKSVTAVMGVFTSPPVGRARGCESCNMKDRCKMRGTDKCSRQTDSI